MDLRTSDADSLTYSVPPSDCRQAKGVIQQLGLPEGKVGIVELDQESEGSDVQVSRPIAMRVKALGCGLTSPSPPLSRSTPGLPS